MFLTYKVEKAAHQYNVDEMLDQLYAGSEAVLKEKHNITYNDFSYTRYRTFETERLNRNTQSSKLTNTYQVRGMIESMSYDIRQFLVQYPEPATMYHTFRIPKRSGGFREINAPNEELMKFMKTLRPYFDWKLQCPAHDSAYAYVQGRDCKKAIARHRVNKSNWFLKLDVKGFFDNCTPEFIQQQLKKVYPFSILSEDAYQFFITRLTDLITKDGGLPQGTPLSPVITNLIMVPVDVAINRALHEHFGDNYYVYTRYADDMLISSRTKFKEEDVVRLINTVLAAQQTPFQLNAEKTRLGSKAGSNWNLGIMYNKDNNMTVGYRRKKKIKTLLFQFFTMYNEGIRDKEMAQSISGELAYLQNIEPTYAVQLVEYFQKKYNTNIKTILKETLRA